MGTLAALLAAAALSLGAEDLARGRVTERVSCRDKPGQSYALYLPSAYTPETRWPVLYMLDARGRALVPIERFRAAAEEFGWILVSSYNSRSDTKDDPTLPALQAMWNDTHERLALDPRRAYATGFSGGGRAAVAMAFFAPKLFAGVIGCGAGFSNESAPVRDVPFLYFGTVGDRDFNYYEMRALDEKLTAAKAPHRIEVFEGAHDWPPAPAAREAIVWMELQAMRSGSRPKDEARVAALHAEALDRAKALEAEGRIASAHRSYANAAEDFRGLADVAAEEAKASALGKSDAARASQKEARKRDERDRATLRTLATKVHRAATADEPPAPATLAAELGIPALRQRAASDESLEERLSAERILANLRVQTSFYLPQEMLDRGDFVRARLLLSLAAQIDPESPYPDYNLAAAAARAGDAARAIEDLRRAVEKGFQRFDLLDEDPDFSRVRADPAFQKWLSGARSAGPAASP